MIDVRALSALALLAFAVALLALSQQQGQAERLSRLEGKLRMLSEP